jgi:GNAT superfamily N-acetyltransferase
MIELLRLTSEDWQVYRDVRLRALADAPFAFGSSVQEEEMLTEDELRTKLIHRMQLVAQEGTAIVGTVGGERCDDVDGAALLVSMWVCPLARGRGVGDLLVHTILDWATAQGHDQVRLWFAEGNQSAARLYSRHGFVLTGERQLIREDDPLRFELAMSRRIRTI